jgi:hypothetical protein
MHAQLQEEAGITPVDIQLQGVLTFAFDDQERPWEVHGEAHSTPAPAAALRSRRCWLALPPPGWRFPRYPASDPWLPPGPPPPAVFDIRQFTGQPTESDEMQPIWFEHSAIPYGQMWADDALWYPLYLAGRRFEGVFAFRGATHELVWHELQEVQQGAAFRSLGAVGSWLERL